MNNNEDHILIGQMIADPIVRQKVTPQSFRWFFPVYFPHYFQYETADFQKELFRIAESTTSKLSVVQAFRSSSKSTILSMAYPIWGVIGKQQKKFVVLVANSQEQARILLSNIRNELENNEVLRRELGPFKDDDRWGAMSVVIPKYGARIMAVSVQQKIRGLRHNQYRPDLIILDDVEDSVGAQTIEQRDKVYAWYVREVVPLGDVGSRILVVGNFVHEDCLIARLTSQINEHKRPGEAWRFPIVDDNGVILWPSKFANLDAVEEFRKNINDDESWYREYLLKPFTPLDRVIKREWIHYYESEMPPLYPNLTLKLTGIDLAISQADRADYTAMVSATVYGRGDQTTIYIHPHPVNERLDFPAMLQRAKEVSRRVGGGLMTHLAIESVAFQAAAFQQLRKEGYPAEGIPVGAMDKRSRLATFGGLIESGRVIFPRHGAEKLIEQLCGFGVERHDDLVDALVILLIRVSMMKPPAPRMIQKGSIRAAMYNFPI